MIIYPIIFRSTKTYETQPSFNPIPKTLKMSNIMSITRKQYETHTLIIRETNLIQQYSSQQRHEHMRNNTHSIKFHRTLKILNHQYYQEPQPIDFISILQLLTIPNIHTHYYQDESETVPINSQAVEPCAINHHQGECKYNTTKSIRET